MAAVLGAVLRELSKMSLRMFAINAISNAYRAKEALLSALPVARNICCFSLVVQQTV